MQAIEFDPTIFRLGALCKNGHDHGGGQSLRYIINRGCAECARTRITGDGRRRRARIAAIKLERGCVDCGYRDHAAALHFDHLPGNVKTMGVSRMGTYTIDKVLSEIAKCDVVCANCHAVRTYNRRDYTKAREICEA
jgi:hypothetical protein